MYVHGVALALDRAVQCVMWIGGIESSASEQVVSAKVSLSGFVPYIATFVNEGTKHRS